MRAKIQSVKCIPNLNLNNITMRSSTKKKQRKEPLARLVLLCTDNSEDQKIELFRELKTEIAKESSFIYSNQISDRIELYLEMSEVFGRLAGRETHSLPSSMCFLLICLRY